MDIEQVENWLHGKQRKKSLVHCWLGLSLLLVSVPALILSYLAICAAYALTVSSLASSFGILHGAVDYTHIGSLVILFLCFPCYLTANHEGWQDLSASTGTASDRVVHVHGYVPGVGSILGSTVNPLAPDTARSFVKVITSLLFIAPALCLNGLNQLAKAVHVRSLGFADAARVIAFLAAHVQRVSYEEIL